VKKRPLHDVHRLVEALAALLLRHPVASELGGAVAAAHAHVETAVRDDVHEGHLLGEPKGMMEGQDGRGEPDADALRARGGGGSESGGVHGEAVVDEVVLGEPRFVETELLRPLDLLELATDDVMVAVARRGLEEEERSEAHRCSLLSSPQDSAT